MTALCYTARTRPRDARTPLAPPSPPTHAHAWLHCAGRTGSVVGVHVGQEDSGELSDRDSDLGEPKGGGPARIELPAPAVSHGISKPRKALGGGGLCTKYQAPRKTQH